MSEFKLISAGMRKSATPAWMRMLAAGKLSPAAVSKLVGAVPQGKTRLVKDITGKAKLLGAGGEGRVMEGFTGGVGPSAIKLLSQKGSPATARKVQALSDLFGSSDIFPKMLGTLPGGRGYVIPKLLSAPPKGSPIKEILGTRGSNKGQWLDFVQRFQKATANPELVNMQAAKQLGSYNAGGLPRAAVMKTPSGPIRIGDIAGSGNIMFNAKGRPFLTDPLIL